MELSQTVQEMQRRLDICANERKRLYALHLGKPRQPQPTIHEIYANYAAQQMAAACNMNRLQQLVGLGNVYNNNAFNPYRYWPQVLGPAG